MNKRANLGVVLMIFLGIVVIMLIGFGLSIFTPIFQSTVGPIVTEVSNLGVIDSSNFTQISETTLTPIQATGQTFNYVWGVCYVFAMIMIIALAIFFRGSATGWIIPIYFVLLVLLVIISMMVSNTYEEFYTGGGDIGTSLHNQTIMSYMLLYSPAISVFVMIIAGIILFTGTSREEFV